MQLGRVTIVRSDGQPGWPIWLRRLLGWGADAHWFRTAVPVGAEVADAPCVFRDCGRPGREHWRWCGEWMLPRRERWRVSLRRIASQRRGRHAAS